MGRRKNDEVDAIAAMVWHAVVCFRTGLSTSYAIEKHFWPENFYRRNGETSRSCKPDRYERGESLPDANTTAHVENRYPGTRRWLDLLLWHVMKDRRWTVRELTGIIGNARPGIMRRLRPNSRCQDPHLFAVDSLWRQGDTEALAVLLGLIRYAELTGHERLHADAVYAAMHVSFFVAAGDAFYPARHRFFAYLKSHFFSRTYSCGSVTFKATEEVDEVVSSLREILVMADELKLISSGPRTRGKLAYLSFRKGLEVVHTELSAALEGDVEWPEESAFLGDLRSDLRADGRKLTPRWAGVGTETDG